MNKTNLVFEIFWLITAILGFLAGVHYIWKFGFGKSYVFFVISLLALAMYFMRRSYRKRSNKDN